MCTHRIEVQKSRRIINKSSKKKLSKNQKKIEHFNKNQERIVCPNVHASCRVEVLKSCRITEKAKKIKKKSLLTRLQPRYF
jgi:precorrin isomerase